MSSNVENELADLNRNGFPGDILFGAVAEMIGSDKDKIEEKTLKENLQSRKVQDKIIEMALKHAAKLMNYSGDQRMSDDSEACSYSWIKWLPWYNCADSGKKDPPNKIELIKEQSYKCYNPYKTNTFD
ncbi:hypothetical protein LSTR_LSTR005518 [Laodelphax striatellus]|uniref:Uncharacterized protein n=1 Tax=Laodelphax striatellus TaxID=195883 RepID=A0A482WX33_LAOST|nr:hypothetical protein LSTR_LSTR005518 [Laodelphax striatellus]